MTLKWRVCTIEVYITWLTSTNFTWSDGLYQTNTSTHRPRHRNNNRFATPELFWPIQGVISVLSTLTCTLAWQALLQWLTLTSEFSGFDKMIIMTGDACGEMLSPPEHLISPLVLWRVYVIPPACLFIFCCADFLFFYSWFGAYFTSFILLFILYLSHSIILQNIYHQPDDFTGHRLLGKFRQLILDYL